ncbi:hypothetical protein M2271_006358 [Streptomyces sp. LBL]|uniref:hypothetical protein n=1 Tax=Streptomyces sp. LBL TaxID=2940562 RepID=UPI0024771744|nr:hypothetical protein [Streptomyces sp. LBL]MDH6628525.1 hypothetical protein [Streptomyces sp. LBL]
MPVDPSRSEPASQPDVVETVVFDRLPADGGPAGYGDRYADDSFDCPASASAQDWAAGESPARAADAADSVSAQVDTGNGGSSTVRRGGQAAGGWPQVAARRKPVLLVAAVLLIVGCFGLALSMVSDTVSSSPSPGPASVLGQVSAPQPVTPSGPPTSAVPPADSGAGTGTAAPPTSAPPVTADHQDDEREDNGREDRRDGQREDGDRSDDG